jgi:predicted RNA-binding Zn-ribbon protein involved in translation (DUF1610 family)
MNCPNCGVAMNAHAEKSLKNSQISVDESVANIYYCPHCGKVEAEPQNDSFK